MFYPSNVHSFETVEEREKAELYTLGRTILVTLMGSIIANLCESYF